MKKILIGSPIKQNPEILKLFLTSLENLKKGSLKVDYYFIDDNDNQKSEQLIYQFKKKQSLLKEDVLIKEGTKSNDYIKTENTHQWNETLIWQVAEYKNQIIKHCMNKEYDFLFLIDSDLLLHPDTLKQLIQAKKDIISEIFWTKWNENSPTLPQVWIEDQYSLIPKKRNEVLTKDEKNQRENQFLKMLEKPGIYRVGGLGACTLMSKKVLNDGVNYSELYNVSFWGEDRHYCIRAVALGYELFVDTNYPAFHIYRESELENAEKFLNATKEGYNTTIENRIKSFLKKFLTCDYRIHTLHEALEYCHPILKRKLLYDVEKQRLYIKNNKIKTSLEIMNIHLDSLDVHVGFFLSFNNQKKMHHCVLKLTNTNDHLIKDIIFQNDEKEEIIGLTLTDLLKDKLRVNKATNNKLTLMMLVRNEANKFLERVLKHALTYVDEVIILDDHSEDKTVELCKDLLKDIPHKIIENKTSQFNNEIVLRKQLFEETIKTNPDWILCLDADEIFENQITGSIQELINQSIYDHYSFRLYDMWDEDHYREDKYWQAHNNYKTYLIRYQPNFDYRWLETPQHCGRLPENTFLLKGCLCTIKLKHLGWSTPELRKEKYERYLTLDPKGQYGSLNQYRSILDKHPQLIKFK